MSNNKFKVLIIEDEANICSFIQTLLETNGYQALVAQTCMMGMTMFISYNPDLVILDLGLPDRDGLDAIRSIRQKYLTPIIVLSARTTERDKIEALDLGANDYITKPFSMRELMARVKANIRRTAMVSGAAAESGMSAGGALTINTENFQVYKSGRPVELTQREYELLTFLASHPDKVFSRVDLMEQVWNYGYVGDDVRTVDVTVRRLREKIEDDPASPRYILTRRGVGYYYSTL